MSRSPYIDIQGIFNLPSSLLKMFPRSNPNYPLPLNSSGQKLRQGMKEKQSRALVIYGSNFSTTIGYPMYTTIVRYMVNIPYDLMDIFVGVILSDGNISFYNASKYSKVEYPLKNGARFRFKQSIAHFEYF
jgi:hypothetical protein